VRSLKLSKSFIISLALNVVLAIALITTSRHVSPTQPDFIITNFLGSADKPSARTLTNSISASVTRTNQALFVGHATTNEPASNVVARAIDERPKARPAGKRFDWRDVESDDDLLYVANLREAGCPEGAIRHIILTDVNELFANKRLKEAIANDQPWWQADYNVIVVQNFQSRTFALEGERMALLKKFLGTDFEAQHTEQYNVSARTPMTGPVLGKLSPQIHNSVQEICERAQDRYMAYQESVLGGSKPYSAVELAKLREQTRSDLAQVLNAEEIEEFLLRFSHNALMLRNELRVFEPTADEFRKIFRVTDPINHKMQLEYGDELALSQKQREELEQQRLAAIKGSLPQDRYQVYLAKRQNGFRPAYFQ
jgi:hypothetical protein